MECGPKCSNFVTGKRIVKAIERELKALQAEQPLVFSPVKEVDPGAWRPANRAAELVVRILHTGEDFERLSKIRSGTDDPYDQKLLLKFLVIEMISLVEQFDELRTIAMRAQVGDPGERAWFGVTKEEHATAKSAFSAYQIQKKKVEKTLRAVRNGIAAHRESSWNAWIQHWTELEPALLLPLYETIRVAFEFVRQLDLYSWAREPEAGVIHLTGAMLGPGSLRLMPPTKIEDERQR